MAFPLPPMRLQGAVLEIACGKATQKHCSCSECHLQPDAHHGFRGRPSHRPYVTSRLLSNSTWRLTRFVLKNKSRTHTHHSGNLGSGFQMTQRSTITWNADRHQNPLWGDSIALSRPCAAAGDSGVIGNVLYVTGILLLLCCHEELKKSPKKYKS